MGKRGETKYTLEYLEPIVKESVSLRDVARRLGLGENTATIALKPHIIRLGIDTSHFRRVRRAIKFTDAEIFVENSMLRPNSSGRGSAGNSGALWKRLQQYKPYTCAICGTDAHWNGAELVLQVDHINGNNTDNRLENLRFLCPNCHTQTDTYNGRNIKKGKKNDKS